MVGFLFGDGRDGFVDARTGMDAARNPARSRTWVSMVEMRSSAPSRTGMIDDADCERGTKD